MNLCFEVTAVNKKVWHYQNIISHVTHGSIKKKLAIYVFFKETKSLGHY